MRDIKKEPQVEPVALESWTLEPVALEESSGD